MTVTGVTDYVIPAILRHHLHCNCASIAPFGLPGPATLMGVIGCASACACAFACACIWPWASWAPHPLLLRRHRGGGLRPVWALIPRYSLRDLLFVGTRGGGSSGSYCRGGRVYPCKYLGTRVEVELPASPIVA
jgi:hypothetical protein